MARNELDYSDNQLMDMLYAGYGIKARKLEFVDIGSFYAFTIIAETNKKLFLKIYPKDQFLVPIHPSIESLENMGNTLNRFRNEFDIQKISYCTPQNSGRYCFETEKLIFIVFEHIEGIHPSYSPNQLAADKLAEIFIQLHHVPTGKFPYLEKENFNIEYALGLSQWINHQVKIKDALYADSMLSLLDSHKEQLKASLSNLIKLKDHYSKQQIPFVITHGDAHHYNVMQTNVDLWLVDWDGLKIAPIERDLWHYENAPLIEYYCKQAPNYKIDRDLCRYYQLQRFFEDSRYYLEQVLFAKNFTKEQSEQDVLSFLNHWGWTLCLNF